MAELDPTQALLLIFVAGCALIHLTGRWADQVTVALGAVLLAVVLTLVLALSSRDSVGPPPFRGSVAGTGGFHQQ